MRILHILIVALLLCSSQRAHALSPEEDGIKHWFDVVTTGNPPAIYSAACEAWAQNMALVDLFTNGMGSAMGGLGGMLNFDFSRLDYKLLWRDGIVAFVRVSGDVGQPNNLLGQGRSWVPFKGGDGAYANIAIARYERGSWRHCDYLNPRQAREFLSSSEYRQFQMQRDNSTSAPADVQASASYERRSEPREATRRCIVADPSSTPLNIRSSPNGEIVGTIRNGQTVAIQDVTADVRGNNWANIGRGWVYMNYLDCS